MKAPRIAITVGDINGIAPEVILKALATKPKCHAIVVSPPEVIELYAKALKLKLNLHIMKNETDLENQAVNIFPLDFKVKPNPGKISKIAGEIAGKAIETAVELCLRNKANAIVTGPVSKTAMSMAGYKFPGQTEMIAHLSNSKTPLMMFVNKKIKLALATTHIPIKDVAQQITNKILKEKIEILIRSLKFDFKIKSPKVAVLGLNPHAGENGNIGIEEKKFKFVLKKFKSTDGPYPADAFFGTKLYTKYDATLAMYHDQGLIPAKMLEFYRTVNYTAGLKIIRTSPDHGTAFDIAGKLKADPRSMIEAIKLAIKIIKNRTETKSFPAP